MSTTYQDAYTITDTINSATYTSNEASGTITEDSYSSSVTHVGGAILDDGISQKSLYELLLMLQVDWDTAMAGLDAEIGVATTTYLADAALGSLSSTYNIHPNGIGIDKLAVYLQAIATQFAVCTALLDADADLTDTNYASTLDPTMDTTLIKSTGARQGDIISYLNTIVTNTNALWVKIDADLT